MKSIIYLSHATEIFSDQALEELCSSAEVHNKEHGVTGYLCHHKNTFFQYIEGDETDIFDLMERIQKDNRHHIRQQYEDNTLTHRRFSSWSMKLMTPNVALAADMDDLIRQHFQFMHKNVGAEEKWLELIWSCINSIAQLHDRLIKH